MGVRMARCRVNLDNQGWFGRRKLTPPGQDAIHDSPIEPVRLSSRRNPSGIRVMPDNRQKAPLVLFRRENRHRIGETKGRYRRLMSMARSSQSYSCAKRWTVRNFDVEDCVTKDWPMPVSYKVFRNRPRTIDNAGPPAKSAPVGQALPMDI